MHARALRALSASVAASLLVLACGDAPPPAASSPPPPAAIASAPASAARPPPRADESLVPRSVLFGEPDHAQPKISPDGKRIAFLAPSDGVLNVWVGSADDPLDAKPVTQEKKRSIRRYYWAFTNDHLLYLQDKDGDENWHVFAVDLRTGAIKDLTPIDGVNAQLQKLSYKVPGTVIVGLNDRDRKYHDVYAIDVKTGARTLVQKNDGFADLIVDNALKVRLGVRSFPDGSREILTLARGGASRAESAKGAAGAKAAKAAGDEWRPLSKVPLEDVLTTEILGFDKADRAVVMKDGRGRDTAALVSLDLASGKSTVLAEDAKADVGDVLVHPTEMRVEAALVTYDRARWKVIDKSVEKDFAALAAVADGDVQIASRSLDERRWVVAYVVSDGPTRFYRYDRDAKKATLLFTSSKALEKLALAKMQPVVLRSRDGLDLVSYLTLPPGKDGPSTRPDHPVPMVLYVHGGPWMRVEWGFDRTHQWLASRGYAVLGVNYRASTGFGKSFINAGNKEWAGKMHDDLIDAVDWAIAQKIADPAKVAIMGGSYGGYATLVGLTFTPEKFACGVDLVGPSNLVTLLNSVPPYWVAELDRMARSIGDFRTDEGKKLLAERSPIARVDRIQRPLLIGQGANDPRVRQAESDQIVKAMQARRIPVSYVLFPDEGHGFARAANRTAFNAVAEPFLAQCLGGPYEPVGDDFAGSTITVPVGAAQVYGISAALSQR